MIDAVAVRYALVGVFNTGLGLGCILLLQVVVGVSPGLANAFGFSIGMLVSYLLNRRLAFKSLRPHGRAVPAFLLCAAVSYLLNIAVLWVLVGRFLVNEVHAQLVAVATYTISFYLLNRYVVFAPSQFRRGH